MAKARSLRCCPEARPLELVDRDGRLACSREPNHPNHPGDPRPEPPQARQATGMLGLEYQPTASVTRSKESSGCVTRPVSTG